MAEYFNREKAIDEFEQCNAKNPQWTPQRVKTLLLRIPTANVVSAVRCPGCKYHRENDGFHFCKKMGVYCPDDSEFFCSYGERKETDHGGENEMRAA